MNRQTPARSQAQAYPPGYRPAAPSTQSNSAMFYATAGQQATQQVGRPNSTSGNVSGLQSGAGSSAPGFQSLGGAGVLGRSGPPGFGGRNSDPSDFPSLGSQSSTYASQAQTGHPPSTSSSQHLPPQQLFMQGAPGLAPPPPPGIGTSPGQHPNGLADDFPALGGEGKDRMAAFMRNQPPQSPPSLANGTTNSTSATPSTNPPLPISGAPTIDSWGRTSPRQMEQVVRPVQQILTSPVDRWGLKALLYEIKTSMGKSDRGMLMFGEELSELGIDIIGDEPLYPTFVTPWQDPRQDPNHMGQSIRIEEPYHLPQCYNVVAPPVQTKIANFAEDTLFFAFYNSPQDVLQLQVAEELYNRGWRYHTELQIWLSSAAASAASPDAPSPNWIQGPFIVFDPRSFTRTKTADEFAIDASLLEVTKPVSAYVSEDALQSKQEDPRSPNGSAVAAR